MSYISTIYISGYEAGGGYGNYTIKHDKNTETQVKFIDDEIRQVVALVENIANAKRHAIAEAAFKPVGLQLSAPPAPAPAAPVDAEDAEFSEVTPF